MSYKWVAAALVGCLVTGATIAVVYAQYRPSQRRLLDTVAQAPSWQGAPKFVALTSESETDQKKFSERLRAAATSIVPGADIVEEQLFVDNGRVWDAVRKSSEVYFQGFGYSQATEGTTPSGEWTVNYILWRPGNGLRRAFDDRVALVLEMPIPRKRGVLAGFFVLRPN